jgi:hypothetical protein
MVSPGFPCTFVSAFGFNTSFRAHRRGPRRLGHRRDQPDAASVTLPGGFTVEAVQKPDVFAVVLARSGARRGLPARFAVLYGNRGNMDALGVPVTLDVPASFARSFPFGLAGPPAQPGQAYNDYRDVPFEVTTPVAGEQVDIPLLIPIVPAGSRRVGALLGGR